MKVNPWIVVPSVVFALFFIGWRVIGYIQNRAEGGSNGLSLIRSSDVEAEDHAELAAIKSIFGWCSLVSFAALVFGIVWVMLQSLWA